MGGDVNRLLKGIVDLHHSYSKGITEIMASKTTMVPKVTVAILLSEII
jgi:hypothetical protein